MIPVAPVSTGTGMVQSVEGNRAERENVEEGVRSIRNLSEGSENLELILWKELDAFLNANSHMEVVQEACDTTRNGGNGRSKRKRRTEESEEVLKVMSTLVQELYESIMLIKKLEMEKKKNLGLEDHFKQVIDNQREKFRDDIRKNLKSILMGYDQMLRKSSNTRDVAQKISRMTRLAVEDVECVISGCIQLEDRSQGHKKGSGPGKFFIECAAGEFCVDYSKSLEMIRRKSIHKDINSSASKGNNSVLREVLCNGRQLLHQHYGSNVPSYPPHSSLPSAPNSRPFPQVPRTNHNPAEVLSPYLYSRSYLPSSSHPTNTLSSAVQSLPRTQQPLTYSNPPNVISNYSHYTNSLPPPYPCANPTAQTLPNTPNGTIHGNYYPGQPAHSGQLHASHRQDRPSHRPSQEPTHQDSIGPQTHYPGPVAQVAGHSYQNIRNPPYNNLPQTSLQTRPNHPSQSSLHPVPVHRSDLPLSAYNTSSGTMPRLSTVPVQHPPDPVQSLFSHIPTRASAQPSQGPSATGPPAPTSNYLSTARLPPPCSSTLPAPLPPRPFSPVTPPSSPTVPSNQEPNQPPDPTVPQKLTYRNARLEAGEVFETTPSIVTKPRPEPEVIDLVDEVVVKEEEKDDDDDVQIIEGEEEAQQEDDTEDVNAPRVRMCAQAECTNIGIRVCKGCCSVIYCSDACQLKHWRTKHKVECYKLKELRGEIF